MVFTFYPFPIRCPSILKPSKYTYKLVTVCCYMMFGEGIAWLAFDEECFVPLKTNCTPSDSAMGLIDFVAVLVLVLVMEMVMCLMHIHNFPKLYIVLINLDGSCFVNCAASSRHSSGQYNIQYSVHVEQQQITFQMEEAMSLKATL